MTASIQYDHPMTASAGDPRRVVTRLQSLVCRAAGVLVALSLSAFGAAAQKTDDVIRIDTELATFEVSVTDQDGRPVSGLTAGDFVLLENGKPRPIDFFQPLLDGDERRPLMLVFALDVSGSLTEDELGRLRDAMDRFITRLAYPESYFAVTAFAMNVRRLQEFTNRPDRIRQALGRIERDRDGLSTHAFDAIDDAVRLIDKKTPKSVRGKRPKRAVVVITDGFPVGDVVSSGTVIERANASGVSVYSLILPSYSRLLGNQRPVITPFESSGIVNRTGGSSYYVRNKDLESLFERLAEQITSSYAIAFYPDEVENGEDEFREVRVESKSGLLIKQNRTGYRKDKPRSPQ